MIHPRCIRASLHRLAVLLLGGLIPVQVSAQFTGDSHPPLGDNGSGFGVAWGDFDGDGDPDIYVANDGDNLLLRNDGAGKWADVTATPLNEAGNGGSVTWGDFDNDGDLDLYLINYLTANYLFRNDGGGGFTDVTAGPLGDTGAGQGGAWTDYDADGDLDLYIVNYGTPNRLLRNDGGGTFADATAGFLGDAGWGLAAAWGDYDNDGDPDLYITNDGPNRLLRNDGNGTFTRVTGLAIEDGGAGQGAAWGDYDNDGDLDLYVANWGTPNKLIRNDGSDLFTQITAGGLGDRGNATGVAWADFDNDGDLDIYLVNYGSDNKLLRNDGGGVFVAIATGDLADSRDGTGAAWADMDGDGDLDIFLANDGAANVLLVNDLVSSNHWLQIDLVGVFSNRSAIGARVRVVAGGVSRIREISGGSGYMSQDAQTLAFGLGTAAAADSVVVFWPSGIVQKQAGLAGDQRITLTETGLVAVREPPVTIPDFQLAPPAPNPAGDRVWFRFALPKSAPVRLEVFDIGGRRVESLLDGTVPAGWHRIPWDRIDALGRRVAAGVYLAKLAAGGRAETRKVIVLP